MPLPPKQVRVSDFVDDEIDAEEVVEYKRQKSFHVLWNMR